MHRACSSEPALYFLASDFRTNATKIISALNDKITAPVIGGFAAIEKQTGKPFTDSDKGILTFNLTDKKGQKKTLCIHLPKIADGKSAELYGSVEKGHIAQVCLTPPKKMISDIRNVVSDLDELSFEPSAALVVSCAGRKSMLKEGLELESQEIIKSCPAINALAGYPSFGEIGPLKTSNGYSESIFHNMTLILLVIGLKSDAT